MYVLLIAGAFMLAVTVGVFWLKDRLRSPLLARLAHSGLVARLALAGAAFLILGLLLVGADLTRG